MTWISRVLPVFLLTSSAFSDTVVYVRIHRPLIEQRLKLAPDSKLDRLVLLRTLFEQAGCKANQITEQEVPDQDLPNMICTLPGANEGTIVVGVRADYKARSPESAVDWSGLAMLPLLAESLNGTPRRCTLVFVAFTGHDRHLRGSTWYVDQLSPAERASVRAMVDLDTIGRTRPVFALGQDDPIMANLLVAAARALRLPFTPTSLKTADADTDDALGDAKPFQRAHIPAISLQSALSQKLSKAAIDIDAYEDTYRMLCVYLVYLERALGKRVPQPDEIQIARASVPGVDTASNPASASEAPAQVAAAPNGASTDENAARVAATSSPTPTSTTTIAAATPPIPNAIAETRPAAPAESANSVATFRASARLVQVDVSATDKQGRPLQGLKASDFTVLENGKPQQVRVFEAHAPAAIPANAPSPTPVPLPPHSFTNRTPVAVDNTVNVLLFDLLNTPDHDQVYARAQFLKFLKALPRGRNIALFVLTTRLQMIQGFTDDSNTLATGVEKLLRERSILLTTEIENEQNAGEIEEAGRLARPDSTIPAQAAAGGGPVNMQQALGGAEVGTGFEPGHVQGRKQSLAAMEAVRTDLRIGGTLQALDQIAHAVAGYPGRKNLVWLSGGFPIHITPYYSVKPDNISGDVAPDPYFREADSGRTTRNYGPAIRATTALLATTRIAVYPIDVRGVQTSGVDISTSDGAAGRMTDPGIREAYSKTLSAQSGARGAERDAMLDVAEQTGGEAFLTNDLSGAIARSIDDGATYYTLAYTPEDENSSDKFRRIDVKLDRGDVKLAYRRGYLPLPKNAPGRVGVQVLARAMQPGVPQSTMLLVTTQVLPPDETHKGVRVSYTVDANAVEFTDTPDHRKHVLMDIMAVAFDKQGHDAGYASNILDATVSPAAYQAALRSGIPAEQELVIPPGDYTLRLGVMDRASQKIGTVDVPLIVQPQIAKK
jgi:VWFA-related protein